MSEQHIEQGAVLVDIGDGYGALIVIMPAGLLGEEVELVPTGTARQAGSGGHDHPHGEHSHSEHPHGDHAHDHLDDHTHEHAHHGHGHEGGIDLDHPPHVAVVNRRMPDGRVVPTLVFGTVVAGTYDLYVRPSGPVRLTVEVFDSLVTQTTWPDDAI